MSNSLNRKKFVTPKDQEIENQRQMLLQPSKQMVTLDPIWKDPQHEISQLAAAREIKGVKKEL